ncbi:YjgF-like protein [Microthyrium microscopicum]|uniref:YjgF-like protein n=1 Tax=Microthyrium microscopicum TaxID=703497 RepID=A0A6A6TZ17_9PEZI|nr:YjgF-like protein [Microthyrium microscopicum]
MAATKQAILTKGAPTPLPFLSQGIAVNGMVYCSGQIGQDPETGKVIEGTVGDRTRRILQNLSAVLEAAGSSMEHAVKVNVFLTTMDNFKAMNDVYTEFFPDPKPVRTCVAVKELPMGTDVEIECSGFIAKPNL